MKRLTPTILLLAASNAIALWAPNTWLTGYAAGLCAAGALLALAVHDLKVNERIVQTIMDRQCKAIADDVRQSLDSAMFGDVINGPLPKTRPTYKYRDGSGW